MLNKFQEKPTKDKFTLWWNVNLCNFIYRKSINKINNIFSNVHNLYIKETYKKSFDSKRVRYAFCLGRLIRILTIPIHPLLYYPNPALAHCPVSEPGHKKHKSDSSNNSLGEIIKFERCKFFLSGQIKQARAQRGLLSKAFFRQKRVKKCNDICVSFYCSSTMLESYLIEF